MERKRKTEKEPLPRMASRFPVCWNVLDDAMFRLTLFVMTTNHIDNSGRSTVAARTN